MGFLKKHVTINCLILAALLPGQSGECKNVLWPFFKGRLQVKGGSLINGWTNLINVCALYLALSFRKAWSGPAAPLAQSALFRLLPARLGIWTSHVFVLLSFGKAISKVVCLLLISAMLKLCGGATCAHRDAHGRWCEKRVGAVGCSWGHLGVGPNLQPWVSLLTSGARRQS